MSKEKKDDIKDDVDNIDTPDDKKDDQNDDKNDLIDTNVALLKAENKMLQDKITEQGDHITELTKKLKQATDLIEDDTKAALIADIAPKTSIPTSILGFKTVEELAEMKKILDKARIPAFKAGTPIVSPEKSPEAKLNTMFDDWMAEHRK